MFYVNENMSDFLPFEYWQTAAAAVGCAGGMTNASGRRLRCGCHCPFLSVQTTTATATATAALPVVFADQAILQRRVGRQRERGERAVHFMQLTFAC